MTHGQAGKGDTYRKVDQKKWDEGWESAFGKKKKRIKGNPKVMKPGGIIDMTDIPQDKKDSKK